MPSKGSDSSPGRPRLEQAAVPAPGQGRFRAAIRVRPGASRTAVGGAAASASPGRAGAADHRGDQSAAAGRELPPLQVSVTARAVDGAATQAAERAVAKALGLRGHQVRVIRGFTSRDKLVEITTADPASAQAVARRWAELLGSGGGDSFA